MGLFEVQFLHKLLETFTVFGQIDAVWCGAEDRDACIFKRVGELQRRLSAELHNDPVQGAVVLLNPQDFHHMFERQRFEIEPI